MCTFWSIQNAEQCFVLRCVCCCCLELTFYGLLKWRSAPAFKHSLQILRFIAAYPDWCCYYECINGWPLTIVYIALRFHYLCNVWLVERFIKLNKEDAVDRCKWRKVIKEARWSGWVWVGECFFWYQPTRVVPDQRLLNSRCCCCCSSVQFPLVLWHCWLSLRKSIQLVKIMWWGVGVVICLEWGTDSLHMLEPMPSPSPNPIISYLIKI